jgi:hypothetical protein
MDPSTHPTINLLLVSIAGGGCYWLQGVERCAYMDSFGCWMMGFRVISLRKQRVALSLSLPSSPILGSQRWRIAQGTCAERSTHASEETGMDV